MRSPRLHLALLSILSFHLPGSAAADDKPKFDLSVKPSVLHGSAEDVTAAAVKFKTALRYDHDVSADGDLSVLLGSKGTIATDARANSENLQAALHFGYSHQFADWEMVATTNRTSDRPTARPVLRKEDKLGGLLDLFLKAQFETDQRWDNYQVTYGPHAGFSPTGRQGITWLVPACYVDYQRVEVLRSRRNQQLGISDDSFWRFDASAGWRFPLGEEYLTQVRWLRPVELEFDLHYFRAFDLPGAAKAADLDEGLYYAGTLLYNLRALNPDSVTWSWWKPYSVYVSVGHGRLPPSPRDQTSVFIGVVYSWSQ